MKYENPQIPEDINVTPRNHVIDFFVLAIGGFIMIAIITFLLGLFAGYLAKMIPFETELSLSRPFEGGYHEASEERDQYLTSLIAKITQCSDLPEGMRIKYHYQDSELVNAFATLGGNIVLFKGLVDELDNENELAMVIAHEIAHIKNRHPIQSIGRAVMVKIGFALLIDTSFTNPLEKAGLLTVLKFSRDMETKSDDDALMALNRCYGHINGAAAVFEKFERIENTQTMKEHPFLLTHPVNQDRISNINDMALKNNWQTSGQLTNLPEVLKDNKN